MTREEMRDMLLGSVETYWENESRPMTEVEKEKYIRRIEKQLDEEFGKEPVTG